MVNYSGKASLNRRGRPKCNSIFSIGFWNGLLVGFEPGTSTSEASDSEATLLVDRRSLLHDRATKCADKEQCWCCLLSMLRTLPNS